MREITVTADREDGDAPPSRTITLSVNGARRVVEAPDRTLLVELVREGLALKGTHAGCLNGDCGSCTLMVDGRIVKSCLVLAASVDGSEITTVEGLAGEDGLHPIQEAFWERDGFQCGFCTPGHLFAALDLLGANPDPSDDEIRHALAGNLCRCTGYQKIVDSVRRAAELMSGAPAGRSNGDGRAAA
jgi:carbon-monoxide dehydrogenase small subunit